ncbi:hypothetical protein QBC37DRAFT_486791 [Rhypophila decipiens]|uniref:Extracellular membrane protein CFEM domain-containing protein n=1 Tax=Rhypophila decipiens TaxID=261697 RepID=A0AAN7B542_9PEZI|nr:hypothetical protein QBC37DRAFT_486791 [Rhypophila decipiens]
MKFPALNNLFIGVLVLPSPGGTFRVPIPVPKPYVPDPIPAVPVPRPGADPVPVPGAKPDPIPTVPDTVPVAYGPDWNYPLGRYTDSREAPFGDLTVEWDPFFSKVNDILEAAETARVLNEPEPEGNPGNGLPQIGRIRTLTVTEFQTHCSNLAARRTACVSIPTTYLTTTSFNAVEPTKACDAWSSLSVYCGGGGTECACYSGTYYVPDQWNTLAGVCAQAVIPTSSTTRYSATASSSSAELPEPTSAYSIAPGPTPFRPISFSPRPVTLPTVPVIPTIPPMPPLLPPRQAGTAAIATDAKDSIWLANLVEAASSYTYYCATPTDTPTYAFGAMTPTPSDDSASCSDIQMLRFKILVLALGAVLFAQLDIM